MQFVRFAQVRRCERMYMCTARPVDRGYANAWRCAKMRDPSAKHIESILSGAIPFQYPYLIR